MDRAAVASPFRCLACKVEGVVHGLAEPTLDIDSAGMHEAVGAARPRVGVPIRPSSPSSVTFSAQKEFRGDLLESMDSVSEDVERRGTCEEVRNSVASSVWEKKKKKGQ